MPSSRLGEGWKTREGKRRIDKLQQELARFYEWDFYRRHTVKSQLLAIQKACQARGNQFTTHETTIID